MTEINGGTAAAANSQEDKGAKMAADIQNALAGMKLMGGDSEAARRNKKMGIIINLIVPIIPIVFGAIFMNDCPVEPMIPIWAVVFGAFMIISSALELFVLLRGEHHKKTAGLARLIHAFLPIWFIVGAVYTYRNYEPEYDAPVGGIVIGEESDYCHYTLYTFAFWYITGYFIMMAIAMFMCCCCCCCGMFGCLAAMGMSNKTDVQNMTPAQMEAAPEKA